jgi:hypothetical protein
MVAALIGVLGFAAYVQLTPAARQVPPDLRREQVSRPAPTVHSEAKPVQRPAPSEQTFLLPVLEGSDVKLATPASKPPEGVDEKVHLVTETFKVMGAAEARALKVEIKDKLAIVDVNAGLMEHGFGSMEEGQLVKALQLVLGQFPEIESFQLMSEGNPVELGHLDLSEPTPVVHASATETKSG